MYEQRILGKETEAPIAAHTITPTIVTPATASDPLGESLDLGAPVARKMEIEELVTSRAKVVADAERLASELENEKNQTAAVVTRADAAAREHAEETAALRVQIRALEQRVETTQAEAAKLRLDTESATEKLAKAELGYGIARENLEKQKKALAEQLLSMAPALVDAKKRVTAAEEVAIAATRKADEAMAQAVRQIDETVAERKGVDEAMGALNAELEATRTVNAELRQQLSAARATSASQPATTADKDEIVSLTKQLSEQVATSTKYLASINRFKGISEKVLEERRSHDAAIEAEHAKLVGQLESARKDAEKESTEKAKIIAAKTEIEQDHTVLRVAYEAMKAVVASLQSECAKQTAALNATQAEQLDTLKAAREAQTNAQQLLGRAQAQNTERLEPLRRENAVLTGTLEQLRKENAELASRLENQRQATMVAQDIIQELQAAAKPLPPSRRSIATATEPIEPESLPVRRTSIAVSEPAETAESMDRPTWSEECNVVAFVEGVDLTKYNPPGAITTSTNPKTICAGPNIVELAQREGQWTHMLDGSATKTSYGDITVAHPWVVVFDNERIGWLRCSPEMKDVANSSRVLPLGRDRLLAFASDGIRLVESHIGPLSVGGNFLYEPTRVIAKYDFPAALTASAYVVAKSSHESTLHLKTGNNPYIAITEIDDLAKEFTRQIVPEPSGVVLPPVSEPAASSDPRSSQPTLDITVGELAPYSLRTANVDMAALLDSMYDNGRTHGIDIVALCRATDPATSERPKILRALRGTAGTLAEPLDTVVVTVLRDNQTDPWKFLSLSGGTKPRRQWWEGGRWNMDGANLKSPTLIWWELPHARSKIVWYGIAAKDRTDADVNEFYGATQSHRPYPLGTGQILVCGDQKVFTVQCKLGGSPSQIKPDPSAELRIHKIGVHCSITAVAAIGQEATDTMYKFNYGVVIVLRAPSTGGEPHRFIIWDDDALRAILTKYRAYADEEKK
jgi:hypothetical protein